MAIAKQICHECGLEHGHGMAVMYQANVYELCEYCYAVRVGDPQSLGMKMKWSRAHAHQQADQFISRQHQRMYPSSFYGAHYDYVKFDDIYDQVVSNAPTPRNARPTTMTVAGILYVPIFRVSWEFWEDSAKREIKAVDKLIASMRGAVQDGFDVRMRIIYFPTDLRPPQGHEKVETRTWAEAHNTPEWDTFCLSIIKSGGVLIPRIMNAETYIELWMPPDRP